MKLLLVEANRAEQWIGGRVNASVHVVPVALLGLAAQVRRAAPGAQVRVAESSLDAPSEASLGQLLDEFRPDLVGIRSINFFQTEVRRVAAGVRGWGKVPVIVGGPIATALGATLLERIPEVDWVAVGEGETTLARLAAGHPSDQVPGLWIRGEAGPFYTGEATCPERLDDLAFPDYSLIDLDRYARHLSYAYNQRRQGVLVTSRGCPYRCTYCFQTSQAPVRLRSADSVFQEMVELVEVHDVHDFYVVDDLFNVSRSRALQLCDRLVRARLAARLYFVNGLRVDRADPELVDRMVEAGAVWMTFGIETAHPRLARLINKPLDLDHARRVIAHAQAQDIVVNIDTMFGFPSETPEEANATLEWIGTLPHPSVLPYHFNLRGYPGCEIVEQAVAAGWDREAFLATGSLSYNDLPVGSPSFSRHAMLAHLIEYHRRFGLSNHEHVAWSVGVLRKIGYSEAELLDMYSVLLNRPLRSMAELAGTA